MIKVDGGVDTTIRINVNSRPEADVTDASGHVLLSQADWDNGTTYYYMPMASSGWNQDGYSWPFFDDDQYSALRNVRVFYYVLPNGLGENSVTVTFDAEMISQDEANNAGILGSQTAYNRATADNKTDETEVEVPFEEEVTHKGQVEKVFDHWDIENNRIYWKIRVTRQPNSAYPLEDVTISEYNGTGDWHAEVGYYIPGMYIRTTLYDGQDLSLAEEQIDLSLFNVAQAVITTESGLELSPGVDYTIDAENASIHFDEITEDLEILLYVDSPVNAYTGQQQPIINTYEMNNVVKLTTEENTDYDYEIEKYEETDIVASKTSSYDPENRIITYEVHLNRAEVILEEDQDVIFSDVLPEGLRLVNWNDPTDAANPSIVFEMYRGYSPLINYATKYIEVSAVQNGTVIEPINLSQVPHESWAVGDNGLLTINGHHFIVRYKVSVEDNWVDITSSEAGYEDYRNTVTFTVGDKEYSASTTTHVTGGEYIEKHDITLEDANGIIIDNEGNGTATISYLVEINPNREQLNTAENPYIQLTDYISTNVELDTDSVRVIRVDENGTETTETDITHSLIISYNDNIRLLSISNIPDKTYVKLTFDVVSRAQGTDTFENTATVIGGGSHSSHVEEEHTIQTSYATFGGNNVIVNLRKVNENNITEKIPDAEYKLYECIWHGGSFDQLLTPDTLNFLNRLMADWVESNYFAKEGKDYSYITEFFKIDSYREINQGASESAHGNGMVYRTDENGYIGWEENLKDFKVYCWEEVYAPDGYTGELNVKHYFVVYPEYDENDSIYTAENFPWIEDYEYSDYIAQCIAWALDNATTMSNKTEDGSNIIVASLGTGTTWTATNIKSDKTSIQATKVWEGDSNNLFDTRPANGIKLQLYRMKEDGSEKTPVGTVIPINVDPATGKWPIYTWYNLDRYYEETVDGTVVEKEYLYTVEEEQVPEYTTTYSDDGEGINSGEIIVTNKLIPKTTNISVTKQFEPDGDAKPSQVKVELYQINTPVGGTAEDPVSTGQEGALTPANDWTYTFENLPTRSEDGYLTYTVLEIETAELVSYHYTVTYSDNGEGVTEGTITVTNALPGNLEISKTVTGLAEGMSLTPEQKANISFAVTGPNGYSAAFTYAEMTNGVKTLENLVPGEYTVTETISDTSAPTGYSYVTTTYIVGTKAESEGIQSEDAGAEAEASEGTEAETAVTGGETATVAFTNEYEQSLGALKLKKEVTWTGIATEDDTNGTYTFTVTGPSDAPADEQVSRTVQITVSGGEADSATVDGADKDLADGYVVIGELVPGEYTIIESIPENGTTISEINGVTASGYSTTVVVTAGDTAADQPGASAVFTNSAYDAEGSITLTGSKVLTGREFRSGDEWMFTISGTPLPVDESGSSISAVTISPTSGTVTAIDFGTFKYTLGDLEEQDSRTFEYVITESGSVAGVTNDGDSSRIVKITVTDGNSGTLIVELAEDSETAEFTNTYDATGSLTFRGSKILKGMEMTGGEFTFTVSEGSKVIQTVTNDANGAIVFGPFSYTLQDVGTHTYTVREELPEGVEEDDPTQNGIIYDRTSFTVTVEVSDNGNGTLKAEIVSVTEN